MFSVSGTKYALPVLLAVSFFLLAYYFPPFGASEFGGKPRTVADYYTANAVEDTGSVNVVTSIVWIYRGYDTLGECTILLTAVLGIAILGGKE